MSSALKPSLRVLIQSATCFRRFQQCWQSTMNTKQKIDHYRSFGFWTHAVCVGACTSDDPPSSFSNSGGRQLGVRAGAGSLWQTLSPRDEAGHRRVQTMLRRKVMAQHVDRPGWLHFFFAGKTPSRSNQRLAAMGKEIFVRCILRPFLQCGDVPKCPSAPLEV